MESRLQSSRFEFKYVIDEARAKQVRQFIASYLEPDAFTVGKEGMGYAVHSLYLDSPDLLTCRATITGEQPAVHDGSGCGLGIFIILLHDAGSLYDQFSRTSLGCRAGLVVDDLKLPVKTGATEGSLLVHVFHA